MWNWKLGFNHEKKLKEDAIENKIKFEKLIKIKQIKIKKGGEKNKWKITWWADMKMWRARHEFIGGRRKERKKKMSATHQKFDNYSHHTRRKRRPRWIKWHDGITFFTTKVSCTRHPKATERLTLSTHISVIFLCFF